MLQQKRRENTLQVALKHQQAGRLRQAEMLYRQLLVARPDHVEALQGLATIALQAGQPAAALPLLERAITRAPRNAACHLNLGLAYQALGWPEQALASIDQALRQQPGFAEAHYRRGLLLARQHRHTEAIRALRRAIAARRDDARAHAGLSSTLAAQGQLDKAVAALQRAIELQPHNPAFHVDLGNLRIAQKRRDLAIACYRRALQLAPDHRAALDNELSNRIKLCDWDDIQNLRASYLEPALAQATTTVAPAGPMLVIQLPIAITDAEQQLIARAMTRVRTAPLTPIRQRLAFQHNPYRNDRLRIGYLSTDFCKHATTHLMQDLFALHDRTAFEVWAYAIGPDDNSTYRHRIQADCDHFLDAYTTDPVDLARQIHADQIDILIDLNGHSGANRIETLALKPAPIQVSYLGYPGTSGAPFVDYLITDRIVTPPGSERWFDEQLVYMPPSYQINSARPQATIQSPRSDCGLPDKGFVFCCFNAHYKLDPTFFAIWMRLLRQLPGSVLWLLDGPPQTIANLRDTAVSQGIDPQRLIFSPRLKVADYLARLRLADLFLDTRYCNAHTTASDALWAGVPVLTVAGERFAARVGKSLVTAAGLPELAVPSIEDYEATAMRLATQPGELTALKAKLAAQRDTCPLFDTARFVRHLEQAYRQMWVHYQDGKPPRPIEIRDN